MFFYMCARLVIPPGPSKRPESPVSWESSDPLHQRLPLQPGSHSTAAHQQICIQELHCTHALQRWR